MVGPVMCGQCGTERARRIERRPGKRPPEQDSHRHGQTDGKTRNLAEGATAVNRSSKDYQDNKGRQDAFQDHAIRARNAAGKSRRTQLHGGPNIKREPTQKKRGSHGARELDDPVSQGVKRGESASYPESNCDRGIEVAS